MAPGILETPRLEALPLASKQVQVTDIEGWPTVLSGDNVWHGAELTNFSDCIYFVTAQDIEEVETALQNFKDLELDGHEISQETFRLPILGKKLVEYISQLHNGKGFFILRGFDSKKYSMEDNVMIFLGISSYIAETRGKQDHHGSMLVHLRHDKELYPVPGEGPTQHSNKASPFHTEFFCDVMAFQVRGCPASGGILNAASTACIYNKLQATRPDLVALLASPVWHFQGRGTLFPNHYRPILFYHKGRVIFDFAQRPLMGISQKQKDALEAIQAIASEIKVSLEPQLGDLLFINNHALLHSRTSFQDDEHHTRHLVRMWLKNKALAWELPHNLSEGNRRIYDNKNIPESWSLEYTPKVPMPWNNFDMGDTSH